VGAAYRSALLISLVLVLLVKTSFALCGNITENTTLTTDETFDSDVCYAIEAPDIYLDCAGHSLTYNGSGIASAIIVGAENNIVRNCIVDTLGSDFTFVGIKIDASGTRAMLQNLSSRGHGYYPSSALEVGGPFAFIANSTFSGDHFVVLIIAPNATLDNVTLFLSVDVESNARGLVIDADNGTFRHIVALTNEGTSSGAATVEMAGDGNLFEDSNITSNFVYDGSALSFACNGPFNEEPVRSFVSNTRIINTTIVASNPGCSSCVQSAVYFGCPGTNITFINSSIIMEPSGTEAFDDNHAITFETIAPFVKSITFLNTTANWSAVYNSPYDVPNSEFSVKWFAKVKVVDSDGNAVESANVSVFPVWGGSSLFNFTTNVSGETNEFNITEFNVSGAYVYNGTTQDNALFYNPYMFTASGASLAGSNRTNITSSRTIVIVVKPPTCGPVETDTALSKNVSSNNTCFSIAASGITLDCSGFRILGAGRGYGVYNPGYQNVTIKDCTIRNFTTGIFVIGGNEYSPDASTRGLWHLNDAGTTVIDSSSYGNNGVVVGGQQGVAGRIYGGLRLDGVDDYAAIPDAPSLDLNKTFTVEAWIYREVDAGTREEVVSKWMNTGGQRSYSLGISSGDNAEFRLSQTGTGATRTLIGTTDLALNTWYHLAATYNGSVVRLYVNDVLEDSANFAGAVYASNATLRLGSESTGTNYFGGIIDEVRILNVSLSSFATPQSNTYNLLDNNMISNVSKYGIELFMAGNNTLQSNGISGIALASGSGILIDQASNNFLFGNWLSPGKRRNSLIITYDAYNNTVADVPMCMS